MSFDLTNKNIQDTFQNLLQKTGSDGRLHDLVGNQVDDITLTNVSASGYISASKFVGDGGGLTGLSSAAISTYNNSGDDRIITSVNSTTVQGESNLTFNSDNQLTIGGDITASGNISASATSTGSFGHVSVLGSVTASNVQVDAGTIFIGGESFTRDNIQTLKEGRSLKPIAAGRTKPDIDADNGSFLGAITSSGDISSSGNIIGSIFKAHGQIQTFDGRIYEQGSVDLIIGNTPISITLANAPTTILGNITASGDISSSGTITSNVMTPTTITNVSTTNITASNNISASGVIKASNLIGTNTGDQDLSGLALKTAISGAFVADSSSFSTRVSVNEVITAKTLVSSSAQIASDISGSFTAASSSFSTRISASEVITSKTLVSSSNQLTSSFLEITGDNVLSSSNQLTSSFLEIVDDNVLSSSAQIASDISGSFVQPSSSFSTRVATLEGSVGQTLNTDSSVTFNALTANTITVVNITSSFITSSTIQTSGSNVFGDDLTDTQTFIGNITASGNISASGTIIGSNLSGTNTGDQDLSSFAQTTDVVANSSTSSFALTSNVVANSSTSSFLKTTDDNVVSSSNQLTSSFLEIVGDNVLSSSNQLTSSFLQIVDDNVLSSSAQIATDISGSFNQASSSFSTRLTTEEANVNALQNDSGSFSVRVSALEGDVGQVLNTNSNVTFNSIDVGHITASGDILNSQVVQMTNSSSVINTFNTSSHQTCKYLIQVTSASHIQSSEMLVMLSASSAHNTEYAQINTINLVDFSSTVSASNVQLIASSSFISCSIKLNRKLL